MATYKLIQDIEAEDKVLGPLTLRQFVFGMVAAFFYYMCFYAIKSHLYPLLIFVLPPALLLTFFAFPFGKDQPTEVWAVAKFNYLFKPRVRIWNQTGVKNLVTITVPKKVERIYTKGFTSSEVNSRLKALADTLDSRGWAVKNVSLNAFAPPVMTPQSSDRLVGASNIPQAVPFADINNADDIFDVSNSPVAQQLDSMINQTAGAYRQNLQQQLSGPASAPAQYSQQPNATNGYWFMNNGPGAAPQQPAPPIKSTQSASNAGVQPAQNTAQQPAAFTNLRTLKKPTPDAKQTKNKQSAPSVPPVTAPADPAILSLADNNDLSVETLAKEANRAKGSEDDSKGEVVVSLR